MQATAWHEQQNRCAEKQQQLQQLATAAASRQMAGQQRCWAAQLKQQQPQRTSNAWCTRNASNQASVRPPLLEATSTSCGLLSRAATCAEYSRGPVGAGRRSEDRLVTWGRATLAVRHQQQQAGCLCQPACGPCSWECRSSISIEQPCAPAHTWSMRAASASYRALLVASSANSNASVATSSRFSAAGRRLAGLSSTLPARRSTAGSRANRPAVSKLGASGTAPSREMRPCVGRRPKMPQCAAGTRTLPPVSPPAREVDQRQGCSGASAQVMMMRKQQTRYLCTA